MKTNLTIHAVVKHEPFVYYSIKSVYDYCDEILLYDTGSHDHTLKDIEQLLAEDTEKKIKFKQVPLGFDEEQWSLDNLPHFIKSNAGKMSVGKCRQMQIDETKTKYAMMVDGDEVHYQKGMINVIKLLLDFPQDKLFVGLPLTWMYDLKHTFTTATFPYNGRVFVNDAVYMNDESPNEQHLIKGTNEIFTYEHPKYLILQHSTPYIHFETVIRPWRRKNKVPPSNVQPFTIDFPEVIKQQPKYLSRWIAEHGY